MQRSLIWMLAAAGALLVVAGPAGAANVADRTLRVSLGINGEDPSGSSGNPSISAGGNAVAFDSTAPNLTLDPNGTVRDVFIRDIEGNETDRVSEAPGGLGADGPSVSPAASADGATVAFVSSATNLVAGDANGLDDIYARWRGAIVRVSVAAGGGDANGASSQPDISVNGRFVVFTSLASNLVVGDDNAVSDVFVRDLLLGTTRRVSEAGGAGGNRASSAPAIAAGGGYVSFASAATNLVSRDRNNLADVFLWTFNSGRIELISVSSKERQQNRAVVAPFVPISDVTDNGRWVTFDSDATNLVGGDTNRDTDVFLRDRRSGGVTARVSIAPGFGQADNDSFAPTISPSGRLIAFESFATNLSNRDASGEDAFIFDIRSLVPSLITVPNRSGRRGPELVRQVLQRPSISHAGDVAAFASTAENLTSGDDNGAQDVFVRRLTAPRVRILRPGAVSGRRFSYRFSTDDPKATSFLCRMDGRSFPCKRAGAIGVLPPGKHVLRVNAGGPGMLFQLRPTVRRFRVR